MWAFERDADWVDARKMERLKIRTSKEIKRMAALVRPLSFVEATMYQRTILAWGVNV
jgi:hypothetical protein